MSWRILIVDDHVAVQRGLEEILATHFKDTSFGRARSAQDALEQVRKERWDIAVVDLNLPGRGGLELIGSLKGEQPSLRILVYSMYAEEQFGVRALRAGADGILQRTVRLRKCPRQCAASWRRAGTLDRT